MGPSPSIFLSPCAREPAPPTMMAVVTDSPLLPVHTPAIEDEYSGPKLEDGKVTITFMKELMQWYKDQKKLHRKCAYQVMHLPGAARGPGASATKGRSRGRAATAASTAEPGACRAQCRGSLYF